MINDCNIVGNIGKEMCLAPKVNSNLATVIEYCLKWRVGYKIIIFVVEFQQLGDDGLCYDYGTC